MKMIDIKVKGDLIFEDIEERTNITRSKVSIAPEDIVPIHPLENHQS